MAAKFKVETRFIPEPGYFIARFPLPGFMTAQGQPVLTTKNNEPALAYQVDAEGEYPAATEYLLGPRTISWPIYDTLGFGIDFIAYDAERTEIIFVAEDTPVIRSLLSGARIEEVV